VICLNRFKLLEFYIFRELDDPDTSAFAAVCTVDLFRTMVYV